LIEPIQNEIYEVVKAIAQRKGYSLVLDRASATSVIFASPNIDISDEVLSQLGANSN
jgi:outer membrane protein